MNLQTYLNYCTHFKQITEQKLLGKLGPLTVWPASSSQQSVLPVISLAVLILYMSGGVVTS